MQDPWTLYWQADRLDSADAIQSPADYESIRRWWRELATALPTGATVLDVATGNGTVPAALLEANPGLQVTGADRAAIDPLRYLENPGLLTNVDFRGQVDICSMPFEDNTFDVVSSQFGIEYAPLSLASTEALRVLGSGGQLQFLMHCGDSEIVQPAKSRRAEMDALLAEAGVLSRLKEYVSGELPEAELEAAGQAHMSSGISRTQGITGQIFGGVNQVIGYIQSDDRRSAAELCATMLLRLDADRDRLKALEASALDQQGFDKFVADLEKVGVVTDVCGVLRANEGGDDEFVIGWKYRGHTD
jgi:ubiquinone/menaquinone biosynthesis C-methylase UbiE